MGSSNGNEFAVEVDYSDPLLRIDGVTPPLAKVLRDHGYYTIESVAVEAPHILVERIGERAGLNIEKARQICEAARALLQIRPKTIAELIEEEKQRIYISTGSAAIDDLLGGGIRTGELTGVSGPYGVGKTAMVLTAAVNVVKGLGAGAFLIDTEGAMSVSRILDIAKARGAPLDEVLEKVLFIRVHTTDHLIALIEGSHKIIRDKCIRFIGIDTFVNPFRVEHIGRETLPTRQSKMNRCLHRLINYARIYNMAVLLTNQVVARPEANPFESRPEMIEPPTGGHVFMYAVNNHLYLRRAGERYKYIAILIDSSYRPRGEVVYSVDEAGIVDYSG